MAVAGQSREEDGRGSLPPLLGQEQGCWGGVRRRLCVPRRHGHGQTERLEGSARTSGVFASAGLLASGGSRRSLRGTPEGLRGGEGRKSPLLTPEFPEPRDVGSPQIRESYFDETHIPVFAFCLRSPPHQEKLSRFT